MKKIRKSDNQPVQKVVLLDINHPSNFYFFKDFMLKMIKDGQKLYVAVKQRKYLPDLLEAYGIPYILKNKRASTLTGKLWILVKEVIQLYLLARKIRPAVLLSFASPYAAITGWLVGKPVITFDDTEHNTLQHFIFPRFSSLIITPQCFKKSFGKKHLRFEGSKESVYLYKPARELPDNSLKRDRLPPEGFFILVRFASYQAVHEMDQKSLSRDNKKEIVNHLNRFGQVLISSEGELPKNLKQYELKTPVHQIHQVLKRARLYFGDSTTMAAEAALLGTPAILIEDKGRGYIDELQNKHNLIRNFYTHQIKNALQVAENWFQNPEIEAESRAGKIIENTTDINSLLEWLAEKPRERVKRLKKHPEIMCLFRRC
mgnify:CR=1 FL=1